MTTRSFVVDSGGTSRLLRRIIVVDSGGTSRVVSRAFVVDSGGTARLVYKRSETFTFTAGTSTFFATPVYYGYDDGTGGDTDGAAGTITAGTTTFTDGTIARSVITDIGSGSEFFRMKGFGSDPGASYLTSLTIGGTSCTIGTYTWSGGGLAQWQFSGVSDFVNGNSYAVEIVHV